ncbi:sulfotransferase family protein [Sorangium sp. So ce1128]
MNVIHDPIFIIGTERSGSNLLRLVLNSHSRIAVPHPPHIVRYFASLEKGYGDLSKDGEFRAFVSDVMKLLETHIYPWEISVDVERVLRTAPSRTTFGVYAALYEQYRAHYDKARWACKSTFMIEHTETIIKHFPDARLIFLVRDPRDVAASSKRSVFSNYHPYFTARLWLDQQTAGVRLIDTLSEASILLVRYEELVRNPRPQIERICAFLGETFEPAMLRYFETREARRSASLSMSWRNTDRPIISDNIGKHRDELSAEEVLLVEAVARVPMERLGYACTYDPGLLDAVRVDVHRLAQFWLHEQMLRLGVELRSLREDRNVGRRWRRGVLMTYLNLRRGLLAPERRAFRKAMGR